MRSFPGVLLLLALAACSGPGTEPGAAAGGPLEAWTFNLRYATADDGPDAWPQRAAWVQELLAAAAPELLGVQEALPVQVVALHDALPGHDYWGRSRDLNPGGEQCGIWYARDRFRFVTGGHLWLSPEPAREGSVGWDAALPRMASWVVLEDRADGGELLVCGTHFDHRGAEARLQSARLLAARLPELAGGRPVILLGDFNADAGSAPWQALAGEGAPLRDSWPGPARRAVDPLGDGTFHGFRGTPDGRRIDWVLVSPDWLVLDAEVLRPRREGRAPSDHDPVRARLRRLPVEPR